MYSIPKKSSAAMRTALVLTWALSLSCSGETGGSGSSGEPARTTNDDANPGKQEVIVGQDGSNQAITKVPAMAAGDESPMGGEGSIPKDPPDENLNAPDPQGSELWTEYFPKWDYHVPPNASDYGERYTYEDGVFHLWVEATDKSTFPGNDSGPRSEVRVRNEYTEGPQQFQADVLIVSGAEKVGIWQVFQKPYPWMIRIYDGEYKQYGNGSTFETVDFGTWHRFHTIHYPDTRVLEIYLDGKLALQTTISESNGTVDFYNKFGVYGREGMGSMNEIFFKNVHFFRAL